MKIRRAGEGDHSRIIKFAEELDLDYPGMEKDQAWLAEEGGRVVGIVALKIRADCLELVALGVDPGFRNQGLGRRLIRALLKSTREDVYLATVISEFFARSGFDRIAEAPPGMAKDPEWCEGCPRDECTIMVRRGR